MTTLGDFRIRTARPLPVIILADVSASMTVDGKITVLNRAISDMIESFAHEDSTRAEIHVAVVTFGQGGARLHLPLTPASQVQWTDMAAAGKTPLGEALSLTTTLVEDKDQLPSRAYRPTLVLVSDGQPNDDWHGPLVHLKQSERASKAFRYAMAIGDDADLAVLAEFMDHPEVDVFQASDARQIHRFFRFLTMSVTSRTRSANPNEPLPGIASDPMQFDDDELF